MCKLCYVHQVVGHSRHDFARFIFVVKGIGELFEMTEHIGTHLRLHSYTHDMTLVLNEVVEKHFADVKTQKRYAENHNESVVLFGNKLIQHFSCYHRINNAYERNKK